MSPNAGDGVDASVGTPRTSKVSEATKVVEDRCTGALASGLVLTLPWARPTVCECWNEESFSDIEREGRDEDEVNAEGFIGVKVLV